MRAKKAPTQTLDGARSDPRASALVFIIAAHCWEKNVFKSFAYLALDVGIVFGLAAAAYSLNGTQVARLIIGCIQVLLRASGWGGLGQGSQMAEAAGAPHAHARPPHMLLARSLVGVAHLLVRPGHHVLGPVRGRP